MNLERLSINAVKRYGASQKPKELEGLGRILLERDVRTILEIGTLCGGTAWFFHSLGLKVTTVDHVQYDVPVLRDVNYVSCASRDFHQQGPWDALFIDGDHRYSEVSWDWDLHRSKVTNCVAFHDIVEHVPNPLDSEVNLFWTDLKDSQPSLEFIEIVAEGDQWGGIGVVSLV